MFNLHIFSRFLRLVRSIRRSLFAFFVAIAMLLATFVIAPTYALSAGESAGEKVSTEETVGAQSGSAKTDGEKKQDIQQSDSSNTESSSTLKNDNKKSKLVEKPNPVSNNGVDKAKSSDSDVNKNVKKQDVDSAKAVNGTDRSGNEGSKLSPACNGKKNYNTPEKCYSITYSKELSIKGAESEPYYKVPQILTPTIKVAGKVQQTLPDGVWLELKKYGNDDSVNYAFFKGENDKNDNYTAKSTEKVVNSDGSIRFFPSKWLVADKKYKFKVAIHYPGVSEPQSKNIINAKLDKKDLPNPQSGDLSLSVYDFVNKQYDVAVSGNKITIKPKSKGAAPAGSTTDSNDKKDVYDSINKLFIDSQSIYKRGELYHHMICKDDANNYTLDNFNGLSLKDKKDNPSADNQTQFKHMVNQKNPKDSTADKYALYENDPYAEQSQSWIIGTPAKAGTFECRVFAIKDVKLKRIDADSSGPKGVVYKYSTVSKEFNSRVEADKQSLFDNPEQNIVEDKWINKASITKGVDWDYKSVTIEVKSNKPPEPEPPKIGDNDLTLKVYPFKNSDGPLPAELPDKNNKISAILGMSLKPFVDATSAADSANKITLRVLCSKGEKKKDNAGGGASAGGTGLTGSGSTDGNSSTGSSGVNTSAGSHSSAPSGSQPAQPSESSQSSESLEYKTWSSNIAELGLSVPPDDNQNTCHSDKEGETTCKSSDPSKKVAARTDKEVSIKPTKVGDYQCVVFALKPDALTKFDDAISKATQSGSLTPTSISSALTTASSTAAPTAFKEHKDFAAFTFNIHSVSKFTLPHTGGQSWNLQLGILAALLVNLLAVCFVVSQSERGRKLILGRWRGLCNHV